MKKYQHLGRQLSREEQLAINGGEGNIYGNTICHCYGPETFPACAIGCANTYAQCNIYCTLGVEYWESCTLAPACW